MTNNLETHSSDEKKSVTSTKQDSSTGRVKFPSVLSGLLSLLALSAPVGYIAGYRYQQGYLHALGLSVDTFEVSAQEAYLSAHTYTIEGFSHFITKLINNLSILFSDYSLHMMIVLVVLFLVLAQLFKSKEPKRLGIVATLIKGAYSKYSHLPKAFALIAIVLYLLASAIWIILVIYMAWVLISYAPYNKGYELGIQRMEQYRLDWCTEKDTNLLSYLTYHVDKNGNVIESGKLLEQNGQLVALFTFEKISVFSLKDGERLEKYYLGADSLFENIKNE